MRDGAGTIGRQLDALLAQGDAPPWELVVADNGSVDATADVVAAHPIQGVVPCRTIDTADRPGVNGARNGGVEAAVADLVAFCDADDEVGPSWVRGHADALAAAGPVVAAGPVLVERLNPPPWRTWASELRQPFLVGGTVPSGWGANTSLHRSAWDRLGGFDERYGYGYDELDLFARAHAAGVGFTWVEHAIVHYRVVPRLAPNVGKSLRIGRAEARFARAHPGVLPDQPLAWQARRLARRTLGLRHVVPSADHHAVRDLAHDAGRLAGDVELLAADLRTGSWRGGRTPRLGARADRHHRGSAAG